MISSSGKIILITGATSGIGSFLAKYFTDAGYRLILHGRDPSRLEALTKSLTPSPTQVCADFASIAEIDAMFATTAAVTQKIDLLINNAFGKLEDSLLDASPDATEEFFRISLAGTANVIRRAVPFLQQSDAPHIVNIVADWGLPLHNIMTGPSLYVAAKHGIFGLGSALQRELDIPVSNICPGIVAASTPWDMTDPEFEQEHHGQAVHPRDVCRAIDFVLAASSSQVRSIVLSPRSNDYNGL